MNSSDSPAATALPAAATNGWSITNLTRLLVAIISQMLSICAHRGIVAARGGNRQSASLAGRLGALVVARATTSTEHSTGPASCLCCQLRVGCPNQGGTFRALFVGARLPFGIGGEGEGFLRGPPSEARSAPSPLHSPPLASHDLFFASRNKKAGPRSDRLILRPQRSQLALRQRPAHARKA